jgi:hypothetical protein
MMRTLRFVTALLGCICVLIAVTLVSTAADPPGIHGESGSDAFEIVGNQANAGSQSPTDSTTQTGASVAASQYIAYKWASVCGGVTGADVSSALECGAARTCTDPAQRRWRLWGKKQSGQWDPLGTQCFGKPPTTAQTPKPQVTPGLVLAAIRRIGLPALEAQTQPAGKTLVNFATIFYAEPQPFVRTIRLLGQRVDVEATPSQYAWHHGDGTTATTSTPGAPYPATDITYDYTDAHITVRPSVDVTYTARFRVGGGRWQDIPDTVTIAGPVGSLRISEATAVLSGQHP